MKLTNALVVSALALVASSLKAAPQQVKEFALPLADAPEEGIFSPWSSVCVDNLDLKDAVTAQYRYGDDGEWTEFKVEPNTLFIFSQQFDNGGQPLSFSVKFLSKADGPELSYGLQGTETRLRPRQCGRVQNYKFQPAHPGTDNPAIDLVAVQ